MREVNEIESPKVLARLPRELLIAEVWAEPMRDLRRAFTRTSEALDADQSGMTLKSGAIIEGGPDHRTRLKAARTLFDIAGLLRPLNADQADPTKPVNVSIVLTGEARDASEPERLSISIGAKALPPAVDDAAPESLDASGEAQTIDNVGDCR